MFISKEDYDGLAQIQIILAKVLKNAVMSELEEEHVRDFEKQLNERSNARAFEIILLKRRKQMPSKFREIFNAKWFEKHCRLRENGTYEIRCTINGVALTGSGKDLDSATERFITALLSFVKHRKSQTEQKQEVKRVLFCDFAEKWFELVKKPTVKEITYNSSLTVYNAHIKNFFKRAYLDELTAMQIQPLFTKLMEQKKTKTAQNVKVIINQIFKAAIAERLITFNPMDNVKVLKHHSRSGEALTYEEERLFLEKLNTSKFKLTFAIMLFCGMRRAELATAKIDENFVTVTNGKKRLSDVPSERKIPITPMLRPYLKKATKKALREAIGYSCDMLSRAFKELCPDHHLHELRHTFITRCQECGVAREVVSVWAGHAADNTMTSTIYTHFSDIFMISEAKKIDYYNRLR